MSKSDYSDDDGAGIELEEMHTDVETDDGMKRHKHKEQVVVKNWTKRTATRLRDYAYQSAGASWIHGEDAAYYNGRNGFCNLWIGVMSAVAAVGLTGALVFVQDTSVRWREILFYVFSISALLINLSVALLKAYQWAKGFDKKIADNSEKASKFGDLYRHILDEFTKHVKDRKDAYTMIEYTRNRFNELERERPFTRGKTVKAWETFVKNQKVNNFYDNVIPLPDEYRLVDGKVVALNRTYSVTTKPSFMRRFGARLGVVGENKQEKIDKFMGSLV